MCAKTEIDLRHSLSNFC